MKCSKCGQDVQENWQSCAYCGAVIERGFFSKIFGAFGPKVTHADQQPSGSAPAGSSFGRGEETTRGDESSFETTEIDPKVIELLRTGKKIEAIKRQREISGQGLKEAKEFVEQLEERDPDELELMSLEIMEENDEDED